jgi:MFS family permease
LFEGVLIATASLFLARRLGNFDFLSGLGIRIGTIAGLLLALRWTSDILFAPGIGWMSDRLGQVKSLAVLVCVLLVSLTGAVSFSGPYLVLCLAFLFVSSAGLNIILSALANSLSVHMERPHIYLGVYATAIDGGAALGPLLAYSVGTLAGFAALYVGVGVVLALAIFRYCWPGSK